MNLQVFHVSRTKLTFDPASLYWGWKVRTRVGIRVRVLGLC